MAATASTSCFGWLKEALLFVARIPKVLAPFLLYAVVAFIMTAVEFAYIWPLTAEMGRHITEMEHATGPSSAAVLLEEVRHEARELLIISIAVAFFLLAIAFAAKKILACFGTSSSSGDHRYSLTELLREAANYAKGPLIATAVVTMLQVTSIALLGPYLDIFSGALSILLAIAAYAVFVWLGVMAMMIVAASVVDDVEVVITLTGEGCLGVRGLGPKEAWRLVKQARRKEGYVLLTLLLPTVLGPLLAVALVYTKQSMGFGLALLSAYGHNNLLINVHNLYYLMVASAYCSQATKEVAAARDDGYAQIPPGEASV